MKDQAELLDMLGLSSSEDEESIDVENTLAEEIEERKAGRSKGRGAGKRRKRGQAEEEEEGEPEEVIPFYQIAQAGPNANTLAVPEAFVPPEGFLHEDAQDAYIPKNSFIGDFVYSLGV